MKWHDVLVNDHEARESFLAYLESLRRIEIRTWQQGPSLEAREAARAKTVILDQIRDFVSIHEQEEQAYGRFRRDAGIPGTPGHVERPTRDTARSLARGV